ncbi:ZN572 protein, partial [Orthonyx spaldingii]|nr:ZN572 protein [Orthonyx spaldingii]
QKCRRISGEPCGDCGKNLPAWGCRKCGECGKNSGPSGGNSKDQGTQTGEKPHSCPECGKNFGNNSALAKHRRMHTGE